MAAVHDVAALAAVLLHFIVFFSWENLRFCSMKLAKYAAHHKRRDTELPLRLDRDQAGSTSSTTSVCIRCLV